MFNYVVLYSMNGDNIRLKIFCNKNLAFKQKGVCTRHFSTENFQVPDRTVNDTNLFFFLFLLPVALPHCSIPLTSSTKLKIPNQFSVVFSLSSSPRIKWSLCWHAVILPIASSGLRSCSLKLLLNLEMNSYEEAEDEMKSDIRKLWKYFRLKMESRELRLSFSMDVFDNMITGMSFYLRIAKMPSNW